MTIVKKDEFEELYNRFIAETYGWTPFANVHTKSSAEMHKRDLEKFYYWLLDEANKWVEITTEEDTQRVFLNEETLERRFGIKDD